MLRRLIHALARRPNPLADRAERSPSLTSEDVIESYRLFLGRNPETPQIVADKLLLSRGELLSQIFSSSELLTSLGEQTSAKLISLDSNLLNLVDGKTLRWARTFVPLSPEQRDKLAGPMNRLTMLNLLFRDPVLANIYSGSSVLFGANTLTALQTLIEQLGSRSPVGALEVVDAAEIRGFVVDQLAPFNSLTVELWLDGVFAGATPADGYRSDLEERFSGSGRHAFGFENYLTFDVVPDRPLRVEIRERDSGISVGARTVTPQARQDARQLLNLAHQLESAWRALEQIDRSLKHMGGSFGYTLENWDAYWRTFYARSPLIQAQEAEEAAAFSWRPRMGIVIPTRSAEAATLTETLASLDAQTYREFYRQVLRLPDGDDAAAPPPARLEGDYTFVLSPGDRIAPDTLHAIAQALQAQPRPRALYVDSDQVFERAYGPPLHANPALKPDFDRDLLLQTPYLGRLVIVETSLLQQVLADGASLRPDSRDDLWLRLVENVPDNGVRHIPRVLHHEAGSASEPTPAAAYLAVVQAHLDRTIPAAEATLAPDLALPETSPDRLLRIQWPIERERPRAAAIVPTRDRLDLLKPCLESLAKARETNRVELEILVVDNGSTQPETLSFLHSLAVDERIRVLDYPHAFNWSAINNHAARLTEAEVLIFLNNDTVVLTPDWCDELYRQAMRPEIGAVGARMLYADGTIQHAGIVLGCANAIGTHEGAGAPLSDPGYLGRRNFAHRSGALTGACLATRAELFHQFGGFDEVGLAVNANDMDYCLRVRQASFAALYDPRCTIYHFESKSRGHTLLDEARRVRSEREMDVLTQRWGDYVRYDPFFNAHFDRMSPPFTRLGDPRSVTP